MAGGSDTVTTIFGGDDSTFQAAARKVKEAVTGLAGFGGSMKFFENAKHGAESLESATKGAKAGVDSLTAAFAPLIAMGAALVGVSTVFDALKRSIELAAKVETAEFHLSAIAGGADKAAASIKRLHEIGDETATGFGTLAEGSIKLQEAGESADQAAESMGKLQKIALNSGSDVNELGEIYARVLTKADVSSKDLVKLAMTGIPGIKAISEEYKNLERNTASANLKIDQTIQAMNRLYEKTEKQTSSVNSFGSKIGLMQASFAGWAKTGGNAIGSLIKSINGVSEVGIGKMSGTFGKEFSQGLKQIEVESGLTGTALQRFMTEGKIGYEDLIAAAGRFREEEHKAADAKAEQEKLANQNALLVQQRSLLDKVREAIDTATKPGGIFASVDAFFQTFNGKWAQVQHSIDGMFKNFGVPLIDALKPALDSLTAFFSGPGKAAAVEWGGKLGSVIKDAMHGLTTGDWQPLIHDGESAFAGILKFLSDGMDKVGLVLQAAFEGPGMLRVIAGLTKMLVGVAEAFGEAMMQAASSPLRKVEASDIAVMPGVRNIVAARNKADWDKFTPEQKKEFHDQGGGAKPTALEELTGGNIAKDSDVIAKIKGFSGVMQHITDASKGASEAVAGFGDVANKSMELIAAESGKTTWAGDPYYDPENNAAKTPPEKTEGTAAPPEEANRDATDTTASPLATVASTAVDQGTASASGTGFKPFQAPTGSGDKKEGERQSGGAGGSGRTETGGKGGSDSGGWKDPDPSWTPAGVNPNDLGSRQLSEGHYAALSAMGMSPIGDDSGGPIDPNGRTPSPGFTQSGGYYYASEHGGKTWAESFGQKDVPGGGQSTSTGRGFKGYMDATGVERSLTGAIGPGGAQPWQAGPAAAQGNIAAAPAPAAPAAAPAAAMASGLATVLAGIDALIAAINKEGGFLEKVLSAG